jgi:hypothetical protein
MEKAFKLAMVEMLVQTVELLNIGAKSVTELRLLKSNC